PAFGERDAVPAAQAGHVGAAAGVVLPARVDGEAVAAGGVVHGEVEVPAADVVVGVEIDDVDELARVLAVLRAGVGHVERGRADVGVVVHHQLAGGVVRPGELGGLVEVGGEVAAAVVGLRAGG